MAGVRRRGAVGPIWSALAVVVVAGMIASTGGCGGSKDSSGGGRPAAASGAAHQLFPDDFTDVCQGASQSRAHDYVATGPHKVLYIQTFEDHLQDDSQVLPSDWTVQFDAKSDAYAAVDLVGCGVR